MELTKRQILDLLEGDGIILIHLEASMNEQGNWRKKRGEIMKNADVCGNRFAGRYGLCAMP